MSRWPVRALHGGDLWHIDHDKGSGTYYAHLYKDGSCTGRLCYLVDNVLELDMSFSELSVVLEGQKDRDLNCL